MINVTLELVVLASITLVCLAIAAVCFRSAGRARAEARNCAVLATDFETRLDELSRDLDTVSRVSAEQRERLEALESMPREQETRETRVADEGETLARALSISERRRRVMQLARRGVECETIASMLNMPSGEVELMVGLGRAF